MSEKELREIVDTTHLKPGYKWREYEDLDQKQFVLKSYIVNESLTIEDIDFSFLNDSLYFIIINTYNQKLEDLLTEKYGLRYDNADVSLGSATTRRDKIWKNSLDKIHCESEYTYYHRTQRELYVFRLYDKNKKDILSEIRTQYHKQKEVEEKREKKREHDKLIDAL